MLNIRSLGIFLAIAMVCRFAICAEPPQTNAFRKVVLETNCNDPMELAVAPDGHVLFVERHGRLRIWKPETKQTVLAANIPVHANYSGSKEGSWEDGLVGIHLAPDSKPIVGSIFITLPQMHRKTGFLVSCLRGMPSISAPKRSSFEFQRSATSAVMPRGPLRLMLTETFFSPPAITRTRSSPTAIHRQII